MFLPTVIFFCTGLATKNRVLISALCGEFSIAFLTYVGSRDILFCPLLTLQAEVSVICAFGSTVFVVGVRSLECGTTPQTFFFIYDTLPFCLGNIAFPTALSCFYSGTFSRTAHFGMAVSIEMLTANYAYFFHSVFLIGHQFRGGSWCGRNDTGSSDCPLRECRPVKWAFCDALLLQEQACLASRTPRREDAD